MTDYTNMADKVNIPELVKALRCKSLLKKCDSCKYGYHLCPDSECNDACHVEQIYADATAAIEELQAQLPKRGEWIVTTETSDDGAVSQHINCSVCGFYWREPKHRKVFKRCPNCGAINSELTIKDREWNCACGAHLLRDHNAAINIREEGMQNVS